jgi:hypothetical protein
MHLLLDLASSCLDRIAATEARAAASGRAAGLLQGALAAGAPPRLALKLAQAFRLAWPDVCGFQPQLGAQVRALLDDAATATPAVGLLRHFQVGVPGVLTRLPAVLPRLGGVWHCETSSCTGHSAWSPSLCQVAQRRCCASLQELQEGLDTAAALLQLVQQRHHALAEDWAATLGRALQVRQHHQASHAAHKCGAASLTSCLYCLSTFAAE